MNWLFDNFQILLVIGLALAAWLKNRSENQNEEEGERRAREEMIRGLKELKKKNTSPTVGRQEPPPRSEEIPPVPQTRSWDTSPTETPVTPPPVPVAREEPDAWLMPEEAADAEPAPWEAFEQQVDAAEAHDPMESPLLRRQRDMQDRLAEIKRETAHFKGKVAGARETQRRLERRGQVSEELVPLGKLRSALQDRRQVKRAIVLREILGPPIGMKKQA